MIEKPKIKKTFKKLIIHLVLFCLLEKKSREFEPKMTKKTITLVTSISSLGHQVHMKGSSFLRQIFSYCHQRDKIVCFSCISLFSSLIQKKFNFSFLECKLFL